MSNWSTRAKVHFLHAPRDSTDVTDERGVSSVSSVPSGHPCKNHQLNEPAIDWRLLARAYHEHHFKCAICKAAGRGSQYSLRCGTGAALWIPYTEATP